MSRGVPSCSILPSRMTTILSLSTIASDWSWVTQIVVTPVRSWMRAELEAHLLAQAGIQIGQRLIEQQNLGVVGERPAKRDALLLAAGQLARHRHRSGPRASAATAPP